MALIEQFTNGASTTLGSAIDDSVGSLVVSSYATFPSTGQYRLQIDNELLLAIGGLGTNTWTVTRGVEGTTATSHSAGAAVRQQMTAGALTQLKTDARVLTPSPASNFGYSGLTAELTAAGSLHFGHVCYYDANGKLALADADALGSALVAAMALGSYDPDEEGEFLLFGYARCDDWNWPAGSALYLSTDAGSLTTVAPSGTGDVVTVLGVATHADRVLFRPGGSLIEHA